MPSNTAPRLLLGDGKTQLPAATTTAVDSAMALRQQADGKLVLAGERFNGTNNDFVVQRLNPDGTPDVSFGSAGQVLLAVGSGNDSGASLALQGDGKIVLAGYSVMADRSGDKITVTRLNADGSKDTSFGTGGTAVVAVSTARDVAFGVLVQADGKIAVVGHSIVGGSYDFSAIRLNSNGTLDTTFGTGGKVTVAIGSGDDYGFGLAQQADGKLVLVGHTRSSGWDFAAVRLNTNGTLDTSFGTGGKVVVPVGTADDQAYSVRVQPDGKVLLSGQSFNGANWDFSAVRLNANGTLDSSFGTGGKITVAVGTGDDVAYSMSLLSDGRILLGGYSTTAGNADFSVVRLNANGALDTGFGAGGKVTVPVGSGYDQGVSLQVQADGRIVLLGNSQSTGIVAQWKFDEALGGLHVVSCGTRQVHFAAAGTNGLTGRCLSLDMRR